jgi:soluble lytic murein transglycosylase-like protein
MMIRRPIVAALACVGLGGLSCDIAPLGLGASSLLAGQSLPHVSAPPPGLASTRHGAANARTALALKEPTAAAASVVTGAEAAAAAFGADVEQAILFDLRGRHTALSDRELVALAATIVSEARSHDLDPALVMAVIQIESAGYHMAVSPVGAMGLMQLLPSTAEELARKLELDWRGPESLFDPFLNVKLGTAYLRQLADRYQSVNVALAAYNWGPGRIDRRIRRGVAMPVRYSDAVMKAVDKHESSYARSS